MNHYPFPHIQTLADLQPHIAGHKSFHLLRRADFQIVQYGFLGRDMFADTPAGQMQRECRGIAFAPTGEVISRPFHKAFNLNESAQFMLSQVDFTRPHEVLEKLDGSLVRPLWTGGQLRLATKRGLTDTAGRVEAYINSHAQRCQWWSYLQEVWASRHTPLLEFVDPEHPIVVPYPSPGLYYLGSRHNVTGVYSWDPQAPFARPQSYGQVPAGDVAGWRAQLQSHTGREGAVIRFADGHFLKVKTVWYARIHNMVHHVSSPHHILALWLDDQLDDALALVPPATQTQVMQVVADLQAGQALKTEGLVQHLQQARRAHGADRGAVARGYAAGLGAMDRAALFRCLDGDAPATVVQSQMARAASNAARFTQLQSWLRPGATPGA